MKTGLTRGLFLVLLFGLASGCTLVPERPAVDRAWFLLEVPDTGPPAAMSVVDARAPVAAPIPVTLESVRVAPAFAGKGLVYRLGGHRYESDFYNEWFLSPREQVEQLLRERWIRAEGPVTLVAHARAQPAVQQLDVLVTAFHGDLEGEGPGTARIGLRVLARSDQRQRLLELERHAPMASRSPDALVAALSSALAELLEDLERRLQEYE